MCGICLPPRGKQCNYIIVHFQPNSNTISFTDVNYIKYLLHRNAKLYCISWLFFTGSDQGQIEGGPEYSQLWVTKLE